MPGRGFHARRAAGRLRRRRRQPALPEPAGPRPRPRRPVARGAAAPTPTLPPSSSPSRCGAARPDGGRVGLVLPQSVLATRDTAPIRAAVLHRRRLDVLWWAGEPVFDADVHTCVATFVRGDAATDRFAGARGAELRPLPPTSRPRPGRAARPGRTCWPTRPASRRVTPAARGTVGDQATATADFRDQYYGLVPYVVDVTDGAGRTARDVRAHRSRPLRLGRAPGALRRPAVRCTPASTSGARPRRSCG